MAAILYHAACNDGIAAAWAAAKALPGSRLVPMAYHWDIPSIPEDEVYVVDFSLPAENLKQLSRTKKVVVLDHHKSALQLLEQDTGSAEIFLDMDRSGCVISWEYFHPKAPIPNLLRYVQDGDLWRWELPHSKTIISGFLSNIVSRYDWSINDIDQDVKDLEREDVTQSSIFHRGKILLTYKSSEVQSAIKKSYLVNFGEFVVPAVNTTPSSTSDVGNILSIDYPFAVCFSVINNGEVSVSFRSQSNGCDVSLIAKRYGGGGHKNASGCTISLSQAFGTGGLLVPCNKEAVDSTAL